ncbi:hypothetical protein ANCCAN_26359 [Ancylostoma caninum]|uniref:Haloacid dehalogenase-like hydrolase n=1 Tax=Ancylostoma caninum TaxID=29170 RepID=A0A368F738_ANCCA|nr:hypothetical protein ANCCAN_26359 [Ancylostoma caninum]
MMGRNGAEATAWLVKEVGISDRITAEEFAAQKDAMLAEMFPKCNAFPGAERLVRHFAKKRIPMAICSGSCLRKFEQKSVKHRSWLDLIPIKVNTFLLRNVSLHPLFSGEKISRCLFASDTCNPVLKIRCTQAFDLNDT